jgi:hypothetical protein
MSNVRTADEAKSECIERMGGALGSMYSALWQELAWVHMKWDDYVTLFGTKKSRIEMLNQAAPSFFRIVEDSLWEDVLLHIARMTDAPATKGEGNLSIRRLTPLIDDPVVAERVQELTVATLDATRFCRDWRDRHIAHRNVKLVLDAKAEPLAAASRQSVRQALQAINRLLDAVSGHYLGSTNHFFEDERRPGGAFGLLYVVRDGLLADADRRARIHRREYEPEDLRPAPDL